MDNMRCYLEIYLIFAYKTTFIFVHMGRKYFINYTTDLFDFIEKNRSELIKEKLRNFLLEKYNTGYNK